MTEFEVPMDFLVAAPQLKGEVQLTDEAQLSAYIRRIDAALLLQPLSQSFNDEVQHQPFMFKTVALMI